MTFLVKAIPRSYLGAWLIMIFRVTKSSSAKSYIVLCKCEETKYHQ